MARRLADMYRAIVNPEWDLVAGDLGTLCLTERCQELITELRGAPGYERARDRLTSLLVGTVARGEVCKGEHVWKVVDRMRWCEVCGVAEFTIDLPSVKEDRQDGII